MDIPPTADGLAANSFGGSYPMPTTDMHGQLDASGSATASLTFPTGLNPNLAGRTLYLAAIVNQIGQLPEYSSISRWIQLVP